MLFHELQQRIARVLTLAQALAHTQALGFGIAGSIFHARQHNHRQFLPFRKSTDAGQKGQPIHFRHHLIQQDQIRLILLQAKQSLGAVVCGVGYVPLSLQQLCHRFAACSHIIHNQNAAQNTPP